MPTSPKSWSSSSPAGSTRVISGLRISDFAVSRDVEIVTGPGINMFTGETGAGKSLVVDALAFVFGARKGREVIATGAERARVEVTLGDGRVLDRTLSRGGRSVIRLDGAPATMSDAHAYGERRVDIHGQSEQLALLRPAVQRTLLDTFASLVPQVEDLGGVVRELRSVRHAIQGLVSGERERERRLDQLRFEVEEITTAALAPGEDEQLRNDQGRLGNAAFLRDSVETALAALGAAGNAEAIAAVTEIAGRDPDAAELGDLASTLEATAEELARELRRYGEAIEEDPERLAAAGERLDLIARLKRKYGDTVEAILEYAHEANEELRVLESGGASLEELQARAEHLAAAAASLATKLSSDRRAAARELVARVSGELELLGMTNAGLAIGFQCTDAADGVAVSFPDFELVDASWTPIEGSEAVPREITETGIDRVEFLASFNPGQDPRPLASVASGGETSRFMLALTIVLSESAEPRCIVLDEVDEGVGGRSGPLIGQALRRLAQRHQVVCITHLPQVAAFGDHHFVVAKETDGRRTWSTVTRLDDNARVRELADMLGGATEANLVAARALLEAHGPVNAGG